MQQVNNTMKQESQIDDLSMANKNGVLVSGGDGKI